MNPLLLWLCVLVGCSNPCRMWTLDLITQLSRTRQEGQFSSLKLHSTGKTAVIHGFFKQLVIGQERKRSMHFEQWLCYFLGITWTSYYFCFVTWMNAVLRLGCELLPWSLNKTREGFSCSSCAAAAIDGIYSVLWAINSDIASDKGSFAIRAAGVLVFVWIYKPSTTLVLWLGCI